MIKFCEIKYRKKFSLDCYFGCFIIRLMDVLKDWEFIILLVIS